MIDFERIIWGAIMVQKQKIAYIKETMFLILNNKNLNFFTIEANIKIGKKCLLLYFRNSGQNIKLKIVFLAGKKSSPNLL